MDKTQAMERNFLLASHCTPEENEGHSGPKVRQLHLGAEAEASVRSPTPQGRVLTTQCCLVYCAWETDPGDGPPKGYISHCEIIPFFLEPRISSFTSSCCALWREKALMLTPPVELGACGLILG